MVADIEEWEQMDASEIYAKRLNAKKVKTPMSGKKFILLVSDGTVKLSRGESQTLRAERRITSYSTEIYRRYQDYRYILGCDVGENIDDYWNVDGDREL